MFKKLLLISLIVSVAQTQPVHYSEVQVDKADVNSSRIEAHSDDLFVGSVIFKKKAYQIPESQNYCGSIDVVVVNKDHRNKGIGKELMIRALQEMKNSSSAAAYLVAQPLDNTINLSGLETFYQKLGFAAIDRSNSFQTVMIKKL